MLSAARKKERQAGQRSSHRDDSTAVDGTELLLQRLARRKVASFSPMRWHDSRSFTDAFQRHLMQPLERIQVLGGPGAQFTAAAAAAAAGGRFIASNQHNRAALLLLP
jgi:hypothetical protein